MHREHINVVKFSNHSPSIFATSSFDQDVKLWDLRQKLYQPCYTATSSRRNVMVCFSPDDQYLLVSAVDNEVIIPVQLVRSTLSLVFWDLFCFPFLKFMFYAVKSVFKLATYLVIRTLHMIFVLRVKGYFGRLNNY